MEKFHEILTPGSTYHVYNRANGSEKMFIESENYRFFLQQYRLYLSNYVDTFCYCLMPNHFHLLVRVKKLENWPTHALHNLPGLADPQRRQNLEGLTHTHLSHQFSRFFNSYTKAFNKIYHRKGSLFIKNFKRLPVNNEPYLKKLVHYIHYNPIKARLSKTVGGWPHSSYNLILEGQSSFINSSEVTGWFDGPENFKAFHNVLPQLQETK